MNFDVPGHVRPGYRADELVAKLEAAGFEVTSHQATYGLLETVTNNISYVISGADQRRKGLYALAFPVLLAVSWLGQVLQAGAGVRACWPPRSARPAARRRAADRCGSSSTSSTPPTSTSSATSTAR